MGLLKLSTNDLQIKNGKKIAVKGSHIIGIRKQALWISQTQHQEIFSVRFKLGGAYPFFKIPIHFITNDFYSLDDFLKEEYGELEQKLANTTNNNLRVSVTNRFFLSKFKYLSGEQLFISKCCCILFQNPSATIEDAATQMNTNYKTLERRFKLVTGLTPSEIIKIKRFNNAILSMYSCEFPSLSEVAYASGYYDQSHFIQEFKQLSDNTPHQFLKEQYTIIKVIQPALAERLSKSYNL